MGFFMWLAIDVGYFDNKALAVGIVFEEVDSQKPIKIYTTIIDDIAPYEPGAFYKRELPCTLALFKTILEPITTIVIDGYVHLGADQKDGLGMHLYKQVHLPVIGVAKNYFKETPQECELYRGISQKPIYVTAVGYTQNQAKIMIQKMYGKNRIPDLLKLADRYSRDQSLCF